MLSFLRLLWQNRRLLKKKLEEYEQEKKQKRREEMRYYLRLCKKHQQEPNRSHYSSHNCDYCKLEAELAKTKEQQEKAIQYSPVASQERGKHQRNEIEELRDQLRNGIRYDEDLGIYVLVWTKQQLERAQEEADELCRKIRWK